LRLIDSYLFDADDVSDERFAMESFNLDRPVSFQVTLKGPATILGFLEETASDSFFHPEILATTVAAYIRSAGYKAHYEDYLMDEYYLYDQNENAATAQDVIVEFEVALSDSAPDF
jgi:hypothetical protein